MRAGSPPRRILLAFSLIAILAAGAPAAQKEPASDLVEKGSRQFKESCGFCHGPDATGARGPDLIRSKTVADDENGNLIGDVIRQGRPDKGMPALSLTTDQIQAIVAYVHQRAREALDSSSVPKDYPVEKLLTGRPEAGKAYFEGSGGCKGCHATDGDLKGIAGKYSPIDLEARMLYPDVEVKTPVTVVLPSGRRINGTLERLDEFTVLLRDDSGWHHSFSRAEALVEVDEPLAAHKNLLTRMTQKDLHDLFAYLETLK